MTTLTVGVIGYHISATLIKFLYNLPCLYPDLECEIRLKTLCGRNREFVRSLAQSFGFRRTATEWRELVEDREINLLVNGGPNYLHHEPCVAALENGKHVFCEKPLARNVAEAWSMVHAAEDACSKAMTGFNCRFIPAVLLARKLINEGAVGEIHHANFRYFDEAFIDPSASFEWRMDRELSGRGILGDLGSHAIDMARFLMGNPESISGFTRIIVSERAGHRVTAPDVVFATLHFSDGLLATIEASFFATGKKNSLSFEIYGRDAALSWDLERLNELKVYRIKERSTGLAGFHNLYVSLLDYPHLVPWPPGEHPVGIDLSYLLEIRHFVHCIIENRSTISPAADFNDGLQVEIICDGLEESSQNKGTLVELQKINEDSKLQ